MGLLDRIVQPQRKKGVCGENRVISPRVAGSSPRLSACARKNERNSDEREA